MESTLRLPHIEQASRLSQTSRSRSIQSMQSPNPSAEEYAALAELLREKIADARCPITPRGQQLKTILDRLERRGRSRR
jgi:SUMO ligase MMS21 Smc5/6 complex component